MNRTMMTRLWRRPSWSPWAVGAGIGVLDALALALAKKPIGVTTAYEDAAALGAQRLAPRTAGVNRYLVARDDKPKVNWEIPLNLGVLVGSALSSRASGDRRPAGAPRRRAAAFLGGALMMFGARAAKGCTSGHAISGVMQLAASSWLFAPIIFATGIATAHLLGGKGGR